MPAIEEILEKAAQAGASDVHLTVGISPKMRINGKLCTMDYARMTPSDTLDILLQIMNQEQREQFEEQGDYDLSFALSRLGRYRVNVYKQRGSVALAFRLVDSKILTPEELGLPECICNLYEKKKGLILITGPASSGKSTTLGSMIHKINCCRESHIITLENPIEYLHPHKMSMVNQREIGLDTQSYASALRSALREDPDVIMIGELRERETIRMAVAAAQTGHLILAAISSMNAVMALEQLLEEFAPYQQEQLRVQLSNILQAVICQQLLPSPDGQGSSVAFEVLLNDKKVRNLIREGSFQELSDMLQKGEAVGMQGMDKAILQLYDSGKIDRETALQYAQNPENLERKL